MKPDAWQAGWTLGLFTGGLVYATNDSRQWWHIAFVAVLGACIAWFVRALLHHRRGRP